MGGLRVEEGSTTPPHPPPPVGPRQFQLPRELHAHTADPNPAGQSLWPVGAGPAGDTKAVQAPITTQQVRQRPAQPHQEVSAERGVDRCVLARSAVGEPDTKDLPFSASRESPAALRPMPLGRGCGLGAGVEAQRGLPSRPSWA
eukprot:CAMPEP_0174385054 /NCGR_PEP_ID=MMETSP0811_2-20130205/126330_1 /TAXON_ID=73025 ORGANISM="Eutreptiella gymnastica-like, Strain CCMP1594" /NCGR_SAMPLE_ID=MMETSP0811_2 /ASSEMBLY_ACC=CAM_ASM_000667 /LENGTH=143 /DNA_ID=CAMNT_0015539217 /DNA_START=818 /DNA_END=1250 /DNA_ORIENTATION=-